MNYCSIEMEQRKFVATFYILQIGPEKKKSRNEIEPQYSSK